MSGLLSSRTPQSNQSTLASGLMIQTSAYGKCVPIVYGQTRLAGNLVWYGDFTATPQSAASSTGKGGIGGGGGGKAGTSSGQYSYTTSFALALSEGPVMGALNVYYNKNIDSLSTLGLSFFAGSYPQTPWSWLSANHGPVVQQATVPLAGPYQIQAQNASGSFGDSGVNGAFAPVAMTLVPENPAQRQYTVQTVTGRTSGGLYYETATYGFNAADIGETVTISYADGYHWVGAIPENASVALSGTAAENAGVAYTSIGAYESVLGAPGVNQYSVASSGLYTFNAANAGASLTIQYSSAAQNPPDQALGYNGIAYIAAANYALGNSAQLPSFTFEIQGRLAATAPNGIDADPSQIVSDLLTNENYGVGFPAEFIGDLSAWQAWCFANGLWISPAYTDQAQTSTLLTDIATFTMSDFVWSAGKLTLVPYGNQAVSGNGYRWNPLANPLFDLDDTDFLPNTNATGSTSTTNDDAVLLSRTRQADAYNTIQLEYLDRSNDYNTAIAQAKDQAAIDSYGLRQESTQSAHMFCDGNAAQMSVNLLLQRQYVRNTVQFTLDQRYIVLDPMDIVAITDARLGYDQQWVRILEITENDDATLSISAEEIVGSTGSAPLYGQQSPNGARTNYNSAPGAINPPIIFEPTAELAEALEVWLAVSGGANWGGCDVWISDDGNSYSFAGRITGSARTGVLTAALPPATAAVSGQTIDSTDMLSVDLSQSAGTLASATQQDGTNLNTLCYVDGEYIAYQTAALVPAIAGGYAYNLSWLVRGAYGSAIGYHAPGTAFARMDGAIFKLPAYTQDRIGSQIYLKFLSFNIYGGGQPTLNTVEPYAYTLQGTALASGLPDVANLRSSYIDSAVSLTWDEVTDFRPIQYEIRKGGSWQGAQSLGRVAHPPFTVSGNDTYWVGVVSQPAAGLTIYSPDPQDLAIEGANITANVIARHDEAATGWSGVFAGDAGIGDGGIRTGGSGDMLGIANMLTLADVLNYGGEGSGSYEIPASHRIDIGAPAACQVLIDWTSYGQHITDNMLANGNVLSLTDFLDTAATSLTEVYPEIALSQDGVTWGAWQKYAPGRYLARAFKARMQLATSDPTVVAVLADFSFGVDVPDRDDHYTGLAVPATGLALSFTPDGGVSPVAFNGGPGGARVPAVQVTILNAEAGDQAVVSSLTLAGCGLAVVNGGAGVARTVNVLAQGY